MERNARIAALTYGVVCYALFFATFLYLIAFVADIAVPKTIASGPATDVGAAFLIDTLLVVLFGLQHSVMARPRFKQWWTRFVPRPIERPSYVLASSAVLILLFVFWQPIDATVWQVESETLRGVVRVVYFLGVGTILYSTFLIDHFDLFGLRQVVLYFRKRAYTEKRFATPSLYKLIRHPLYVGWITMFWAAPTMTAGHFLFAIGMTAYILLAIPMEERDLEAALGEPYRRWRERTPAFVPGVGGAGAAVSGGSAQPVTPPAATR
jgi:protein-S-isoprenylcysteine O-methyltransferase Ste14